MFKDLFNFCLLQDYCGVVYSSNFCIEILLNMLCDEIVVCNLGFINLFKYINNGEFDLKMFESMVCVVIWMFDNVIDINFYLILEVKVVNLCYWLIGFGLMGFQDVLVSCGISYVSDEVVEFVD